MVGIVVVSHSAEIAEGIRKMVRQMTSPGLPLIAAGGTRDGRLGTDANMIREAIESLAGADGVVVLADLGSAILSVDLACELLPPAMKTMVALADAPLVEGSIAAAVESSVGRNLTQVRAAAEEARHMRKI